MKGAEVSRRVALRRFGNWVALTGCSTIGTLGGCGGGGTATVISARDAAAPAPPLVPSPSPSPSAAPVPSPVPAPSPPVAPPPAPGSASPALRRLQAALRLPALALSDVFVDVSQSRGNSLQTALAASWTDLKMLPPIDGADRASLATAPQFYGHRRDLWLQQSGGIIAGQQVIPVSLEHRAATGNTRGACGLHFEFDGRAFEVLFGGTDAAVTLIADGRIMAPRLIRHTLRAGVQGLPLNESNAFVRFEFQTTARRRISLYANSSRGPCSIAILPGDTLMAWDRSAEASFCCMGDSYGDALGRHWEAGVFWEAAALLGIPHIDRDALGGTGYAPNNTNADTRLPGNAFGARVASATAGRPDLFLTAGGINDNNSMAALPLYASGADASAAFDAAVSSYYRALRSALPDSVLAATGPWQPRQSMPTDPVQRSKAERVKAALREVGGPWVYIDNLDGGWINSAGAMAAPDGPWQTGTGNSAAPAGDGNADFYLQADGVHPNEAGAVYLAGRIAAALRAALQSL